MEFRMLPVHVRIVFALFMVCCYACPQRGFAEVSLETHFSTEKKQRKKEKDQYTKKIEQKIALLNQLSPRTKVSDLRRILIETRDLINEYNVKFNKPLLTRKSFRETIKKFQSMHSEDPKFSGSQRVVRKFRKQLAELMFPSSVGGDIKCKVPTDSEINQEASLGECLPSIVRDLGICSVGIGLMACPFPVVKNAGLGLIVTSGDRIACTIYNSFYTDEQQEKEKSYINDGVYPNDRYNDYPNDRYNDRYEGYNNNYYDKYYDSY